MMNRLAIRVALALCLVAALVAAGRWAGSALSPSKPDNAAVPALAVAERHLDFGEALDQAAFRWVLPIENTSGEDVRITGFGRSCSCAAITPKELLIPAGETREVTLSLDLRPQKPAAGPSWPYEAEITPTLQDRGGGQSAPTWVVRGTVRGVLRPERPEVEFGRWSADAGPLPLLTVAVTAHMPVGRVKTRCDSALLSAHVSRVGREPGQFELSVEGEGRPKLGAFEVPITLVAESPEGRELPAKVVVARGTVVPDCEATPSAVLFGARPAGTRCEERVTVRSLTGKALRLKSLKVSGAGLEAEEAAVPPGCIGLRVRQLVVGTGLGKGNVVLTVGYESGRERAVLIPVAHYALPAAPKAKTEGER